MSKFNQPSKEQLVPVSPETQEKIPSLDQLVDLAKFYRDRFRIESERASGKALKSGKEKEMDRFDGIAKYINRLAMKTQSVDAAIDKLRTELETENDPEKQSVLEETLRFLEQNRSVLPEKRADFVNWQQEQERIQRERAQEVHGVRKKTAEQVRDHERKMEQELRESFLLEQLKESAVARVLSSIPTEYSERNSAGFQVAFNNPIIGAINNRLGRRDIDGHSMGADTVQNMIYWLDQKRFLQAGARGRSYLHEALRKLDFNEFVALEPLQAPVYEEQTYMEPASGLKGFLGKKIEKKKMVQKGEKTLLTSEISLNDQKPSEPIYRFMYYATGEFASDDTPRTGYQDHSGRSGQMLSVETFLPKTLAEKMKLALETNPAFARKIAEVMVLKNTKITPDAWHRGVGAAGFPMRPPYEAWAKERGGGSNMIMDLGDEKSSDMTINDYVKIIKN